MFSKPILKCLNFNYPWWTLPTLGRSKSRVQTSSHQKNSLNVLNKKLKCTSKQPSMGNCQEEKCNHHNHQELYSHHSNTLTVVSCSNNKMLRHFKHPGKQALKRRMDIGNLAEEIMQINYKFGKQKRQWHRDQGTSRAQIFSKIKIPCLYLPPTITRQAQTLMLKY